jgi:hypothetical protein
MRCIRPLGLSFLLASGLLFLSSGPAFAFAGAGQHSRKYKAPPETSRIEIVVTKKSNGKPIANAAVVFNPTKDGKDEGNLEVKTDPEGKAVIDVIPTGSLVRVQIIADGFATFAEDYLVTESSRQIDVVMLRPQEQISAYEDNQGKSSARKAGVQEPTKPTPAAKPGATPPATPPPANAQPAPAAAPKQ